MLMKLNELLKKFNLNLDLSDELLNCEIEGEYKKVEKKKLVLTENSPKGIVMKEFDGYSIKGVDCECLIAPSNTVRTVSCYYKKENFSHGYSYGYDGKVTSIV